ncbi:MAG: phosphodiester glycosidase family protein [Bacilli bacterium]|nr:phosphodiester glycosidase family protein [Bacilli bacterium]
MSNENVIEAKPKKKKKRVIRLWVFFAAFVIICITSFLTLLYGPWHSFRNWLITTAMTTMSHQYLATWFYDDKTIEDVLSQNYVKETGEDTDITQVSFVDYTTGSAMFLNKYEKEVLTKDEGNDLYKLININEDKQRGYLVVVYDPSKVKIATSKSLGKSGQMLTTIAKDNNAVVAMNASGFIDPNYMSNGGRPHGPVIKDGKLVSNEVRVGITGGIIGFDKNNTLILGKMSAQEALNKGIRDAVDFGPFLIVNGKPSFIKGNGGWGEAPRSAIGQRKDGIVLFLVMDGRDYANGIAGSDMVNITEFMLRYGAYNAANLDGGTSSGLVINNELVSKPVNGNGQKSTRAIPDAWIVTE